MKNFSIFLEELNGVFIEHGGTIFKIVGWEYIEPGYYRVGKMVILVTMEAQTMLTQHASLGF